MSLSPDVRPWTRHLAPGGAFHGPVPPADLPRTAVRHGNDRWAARVGRAPLDDAEGARAFGRSVPLPGSLPGPVAPRRHGRRFGPYDPGDGRGFPFARMHDSWDGRPLDLGPEGSGPVEGSRP